MSEGRRFFRPPLKTQIRAQDPRGKVQHPSTTPPDPLAEAPGFPGGPMGEPRQAHLDPVWAPSPP